MRSEAFKVVEAPQQGRTLNLEEVRDAVADGVVVGFGLGGYAKGFRRDERGRWWSGSYNMSDEACAGLDRVREYWRRRALAEFAAAKVADHLGTALAAAREHALLFAKIGDDGVFPDDKAQDHRASAMGFSYTIKDLERLLNSYKHHGDVP